MTGSGCNMSRKPQQINHSRHMNDTAADPENTGDEADDETDGTAKRLRIRKVGVGVLNASRFFTTILPKNKKRKQR